MAKKKTTSDAKEPASKPRTKRATTARKSASKQSGPGAQPDVPLIDTTLAAQSAVKMLLNRDKVAKVEQEQEASSESSAFKQLKETLKNPVAANPLLQPVGGGDQKKSNLHSILNKQTGHNQTLGHFNRTGVPRRTPG